MHLRHPVVLTTVEEDFKKIGILTEDDDKPVSEKKGKKAAEADDVEVDDAEEGVDGDKEDSVKTKKESSDDDAETLAEKAIRLKRHTSGERLKWRRAKKKGGAKAAARKYRKKSTVKRMMRKHRLKAMRLRHGKKAGRKRLVFGNDQIANMMEEAQALIQSLDEQKVEQSVKAFANIAIIAEMLARSFAKFSEDAEGEDSTSLDEAANFFREMAEEAADIARTLKTGPVEEDEELDFEEIGEVFKAQMSDLLNGLEMYADITEDDDLGEIAKSDDDDTETVSEGEDEDDDEDDDEEDDEDDDDEKGGDDKKKLPPFMKKKAEGKGKAKK